MPQIWSFGPFRAMLATIFAYFSHFASFLHVSRRRSESPDVQAGTNSSICGRSASKYANKDSTIVRCVYNANVEDQSHPRQPCTDFCPPHSSRGSLLCVERGRPTILRDKRVGIYYAVRAGTCGLPCLLLAIFWSHLMSGFNQHESRQR